MTVIINTCNIPLSERSESDSEIIEVTRNGSPIHTSVENKSQEIFRSLVQNDSWVDLTSSPGDDEESGVGPSNPKLRFAQRCIETLWYSRAVTELTELLESNDEWAAAEALYLVGEMLLNGRGVPTSIDGAVRCWKLASNQEVNKPACAWACANLGELFYSGKDLPKDILKAEFYYNEAFRLKTDISDRILVVMVEKHLKNIAKKQAKNEEPAPRGYATRKRKHSEVAGPVTMG